MTAATAQDNRIVVVGSGAFGTALAAVAAASGKAAVTLLTRRESIVEDFKQTGRNDSALPGIDLPETLTVSDDPTVLEGAGIVLFAMPSQAQREAARSLHGFIGKGADVVICAKGIERVSGRLLTDVVEEELHLQNVAVLSGPGFAADIAKGLPTAMVIAANGIERASLLAEALSGATFRLYPSADRIGVQLGGALKNVLAIACGIAAGKNLGDSARAALTTRAFTELTRFGKALGGRPETLTGLSGLGDLLLTCSSRQSRNYSFGLALGEGKSTEAALAEARGTVEGIATARIVARLAREQSIDMPISAAVAAVIDGASDPETEIARLLARPVNPEFHRG